MSANIMPKDHSFVYLVGNKVDLESSDEKREVDFDEA